MPGLSNSKGLMQLQSLDLGGTQVTDAGAACLKGLTRLISLDLPDTQVTSAGAAGLRNALPHCRIVCWHSTNNDAGPGGQAAASMGKSLNLDGKAIVDEKLPGRPAIAVDLSSSDVTDVELEQLEGLARVRNLNLASTRVTDAGLERLKGRRTLQSLNVGWTEVTGRQG